eukprot:gb/GECH01009696.1/.p1 GENE.gb/GECH01009696.1/~~gb/GECH01009696.1/.p1  ORF type:complete len:357 (+),score=89.89 gb/GECH01009696.1/:1-1071(+)
MEQNKKNSNINISSLRVFRPSNQNNHQRKKSRRKNFGNYQHPKIVATFNKDNHDEITIPGKPDRFVPRELPIDLNDGFESFRQNFKEKEIVPISPIFKALHSKGYDIQNGNKTIDFITFRNNLNKIMLTPYNRRDPWSIRIQKMKNHTICFDIVQNINKPVYGDASIAEKAAYWGSNIRICQDSLPESEFSIVVQSKLDQFNILLAAEVDGYDPSLGDGDAKEIDGQQMSNLIEIKTTKDFNAHSRVFKSFQRHKTLKYWVQSYLAGVPWLYIGLRSDDGVVSALRRYRTRDLRSVAEYQWDDRLCLEWLSRVLWFVQQNVTSTNVVYRLNYNAPFQELVLEYDEDHSGFIPSSWG